MSDITTLSAAKISDAVKKGEITAEAVALAHLARGETHDPKVKAFLTVTKDLALEQARAVDAKRKKGETLGALAGVPVALKDNLQLTGVETTCASEDEFRNERTALAPSALRKPITGVSPLRVLSVNPPGLSEF